MFPLDMDDTEDSARLSIKGTLISLALISLPVPAATKKKTKTEAPIATRTSQPPKRKRSAIPAWDDILSVRSPRWHLSL